MPEINYRNQYRYNPRNTKNLHRDGRPFYEDSFRRYCNYRGMRVYFAEGVVIIKTLKSTWRIHHDGRNVITVLHMSSRVQRKSTQKPSKYNNRSARKKNQKTTNLSTQKYNDGYHKQNWPETDIFDIANRISIHDATREHPLKWVDENYPELL
jgi:hypothetical protein